MENTKQTNTNNEGNARRVRLTRRSYRRKLVAFGVAIFISIALLATGFAAWMLSTDAHANTTGGVAVADVSDAGVEVTDINFAGDIKDFTFEPVKDDNDGRVRWDEKSGTYEDLDIQISWTVKNAHSVGTTSIAFEIPEAIQNAIDKNYLDLPDAFGTGVKGTNKDTNKVVYTYTVADITALLDPQVNLLTATKLPHDSANPNGPMYDMKYTLTLKFLWGTHFEKVNPSIYYDTVEAGINTPYNEVKKTLLDIKSTIYGVNSTDKGAIISKIDSTDTARIEAATAATDILDVLAYLDADEQKAFYDSIIDRSPAYMLYITAKVK